MGKEEIAVKKVKSNLHQCRHILTYGNETVWDRLSSYSTSLITVNTDKTFSKSDNRILKALEDEEENAKLVQRYVAIINCLDNDSKIIINMAFMKDHMTIEQISNKMGISIRTTQRLLAESFRVIAYMDGEIDYTREDLNSYYMKDNGTVSAIKKTVYSLLRSNEVDLSDENVSVKDVLAFYERGVDIQSQYEKRKMLRVIYGIAYKTLTIDEDMYITLMLRSQASTKEIQSKLKKKH